jgi:hypothetical protein
MLQQLKEQTGLALRYLQPMPEDSFTKENKSIMLQDCRVKQY